MMDILEKRHVYCDSSQLWAATEKTMHSSITCNQKVICMGRTFGYCVHKGEVLDDDKKTYKRDPTAIEHGHP